VTRLPPLPSRYALLVVFGVLLVLLVVVSVLGLTRTEQVNGRVQAIYQAQDVKTDFVITIFRITRERSVAIEQLFADESATARAAAAERYRLLGDELTQVGRKLASLQLTTDERRAMESLQAAAERDREVRDAGRLACA